MRLLAGGSGAGLRIVFTGLQWRIPCTDATQFFNRCYNRIKENAHGLIIPP